nr:diguanylate cyclase [Alteromonas profundi]
MLLETHDDLSSKKRLGITYTDIAQSLKRLKRREETADYYRKALAVFTEIDNKKYMARTLNTLAEAERYLGNFETALNHATQSLKIHSQIDDPEGEAKAHMGAAIIYRYIERYQASLAHARSAFVYFSNVNDASGIAKTSNEIGHIYIRLGQFDLARSFFSNTIKLPRSKVQARTLATALRETAVIDLNTGNYEAAARLAEQALAIYKDEKEIEKQSHTTRIIGDIYRAKDNVSSAIGYYRQSLSLAQQVKSDKQKIDALIPLGEALLTSDLPQALLVLSDALALAEKTDSDEYQLRAIALLRKGEKLSGNISRSLDYAEQELELSETIHNQESAKQLAIARAALHSYKLELELEGLRKRTELDRLALEKKNNEIAIARSKQQISELELSKSRYAKFTLSLLLTLCTIAALFIFRRFMLSKQRNKELDYLASHDPLTNCYNRRFLFESLNRVFNSPPVPNNLSFIMLDIDHFKTINDTYGHSAGDRVLQGVAKILLDNVEENAIVARFGGEEFCIVLPNTNLDNATTIAEDIRRDVEGYVLDSITLTCSIGITSTAGNATTVSELIDQADMALFDAKSEGRNKVTVWRDNEQFKGARTAP